MNFQELVAKVILNTNRPDLGFTADGGDGQIPNAVLSATQSLHTMDFFWRDLVSVDLVFDAAAYIQTLDVRVLPRFRALGYFRKWDPSYNSSQQDPNILPPLYSGASMINQSLSLKMLKTVDLGGLFDSYGTELQDVCYAAGDTLFIKSSTNLSMGKLSYYAYPSLNTTDVGVGYSSWIADNHPYAIIAMAEQFISVQTGDMDKAREMMRPKTKDFPGGICIREMDAIKMSNTEAEGR